MKKGAFARFGVSFCVLGCVAASPVFFSGCSVNPATGERAFTLLSWEDERRLGSEAAPQFTQEFGGEVPDTALQRYVDGIGHSMAATVEPGVPELDWEFTLLDSDVVNAFALPGGKVFITRGLASRFENEAQLAGVLGHEIGHVTARHGNQRISKQIGFNVLLAGLAIGVGVSEEDSTFRRAGEIGLPALAIGGNVVLLSYGRNEEIEADYLGMRYMSNAGYDPRGQLQVMEILSEAAAGPRPPEFLSTHPHPETRIDRIRELLAGEFAHTQNNPDYGLFEDRYRTQFLGRLSALPPSAHSPAVRVAFSQDDPATWCAHCAGVRTD